jgi:plasmid stabilization system protein ParE
MSLEYHPAVGAELESIRAFYESRRPGLGKEFIEEFEKLVLQIADAPGRWMVVEADIRRALMRRFPYIIYFRQISQERIRITVAKYQRRHPAYGRKRR